MPVEFETERQIAEGGEGFIYEVQGQRDLLLKIYKNKDSQGRLIVTSELQRKLEYMKNNPPKALVDQRRLAWPVHLLYAKNQLAGFVMPKLPFSPDDSLFCISAYHHPTLEQDTYAISPNIQTRIATAINLASTVNDIHNAGYVIGDMNDANIGINRQTSHIQIVDCDSFTVTDSSGVTLRTNVCMEGYLAPEIIRHCNSERAKGHPYALDTVALPTFTKESDLFCLAVHIFRLLMNGVHPFIGVNNNAVGSHQNPFDGNEGIERNNYVFKSGLKTTSAICLSPNEISPKIKALFDKAFLDGDIHPSSRPTAHEWYHALLEYLQEQKRCSKNSKHYYYNKLSTCPYCEADKRHYFAQKHRQQDNLTYRPNDPPIQIVIPSDFRQSQKQNTAAPHHQRKIRPKHIVLAVASVIFGLRIILPRVMPRYDYQPTQQRTTEQYSEAQFVKAEGLSLRAGPGTNYETLLYLSKNSVVYPLANVAKSGDWVKVNFYGNIGWVDENYLSPAQVTDGETFTVAKYVKVDGLNLRNGPGTDYSSLFVLPINAVVYLSDTNLSGNWVKVKYNDYIGWLNENYLRD